ncbi:hypothetical protein FRB98_006217 [Tulasnella sp. 332]|nr:hypothetical protein FRB98_006217 [Tulasnella sp. 332]
MIPSTLRSGALPPSKPSCSSSAPHSASSRPSITIPSYNGPHFQSLGSRNGGGFIDPMSSPYGIAQQSPLHSSTPLTSPYQQDYGSVLYSPVMAPPFNAGGMPPSSFISPSMGLASLTILTPQRPLPDSLPPTPQVTSHPSPRVNPFAIQEESHSTSSLSGNPLPSLRSSYTKMLRRQSNGSAAVSRKTNMPPPLSPIVTKPLQNAPDVWEGMNEFINSCEQDPAVGNDSPFPVFGPGTAVSIGSGGTATLGGDNEAALKDLQQALTSPMSPALQHPLNNDPTTSFLAAFQSPAVVPFDEFDREGVSASAPSSFGPSPDILVSPCEASPQHQFQMWPESGMADAKLFNDMSVHAPPQQQFSPMPVHRPALGLHSKDAASSSQESSASSSGSNLVTSTSAPTLTSTMSPSLSPSANKRPRLHPHPYAQTTSSSHRRHVSASSGSSAAPSPYLGSAASSTRPNGYRRNVKPTDLLPLEAPIQPRKYNGVTSTSRKEVPSSVARTFNAQTAPLMARKRSSEQAGLSARDHDDAQQEQHHPMDSSSSSEAGAPSSLAGGSPAMTSKDELAEHIKEKRRLNTLAARKTRQRKAQFAEEMKETVARLTRENEQLEQEKMEWQQRAEHAESLLIQLGVRL